MRKSSSWWFSPLWISLACGGPLPSTSTTATTTAADTAFYNPNVDIFVVRGPDADGRFVADQGQEPSEFLQTIFTATTEPSMNYFMNELGIAFYSSRVRVFYVKNAITDNLLSHVTGDFSFTLTDATGTADKGTVYSDSSTHLNVLLAGNTSPTDSYEGVANLPGPGLMLLSKVAAHRTPAQFCRILSHELGHNFDLIHSFESGSCLYDSGEYSSTRIMSYGEMDSFITCEKTIGEATAVSNYDLSKTEHQATDVMDFQVYDGTWDGGVTIGTPPSSTLRAAIRPTVILD